MCVFSHRFYILYIELLLSPMFHCVFGVFYSSNLHLYLNYSHLHFIVRRRVLGLFFSSILHHSISQLLSPTFYRAVSDWCVVGDFSLVDIARCDLCCV